ncbi:MAG: putative LPS assembly protein LptD [Rikenellaceae bacterium]
MSHKNLKYLKEITFFTLFVIMIFATPSRANMLGVRKLSKHGNIVHDVALPKSDTIPTATQDSTKGGKSANLLADSTVNDTSVTKQRKPLLDDIIYTKNEDSMIYDVLSDKIYLYKNAEAKYAQNILNADYMEVVIKQNQINAKGMLDTTTKKFTRTSFDEGGKKYEMDSISYNLKSAKAKIKGVFFQEGEGVIHGEAIKKMEDNVINIKGGKYTTCNLEHPHFYLSSSKAQLIESKGGKKIVIGPSYLVMEDVPIPLIVPFGFFPIMQNRNSGIIIPEFGEEVKRGFFLRRGGYYWAINDYMDVALRAGIYTLGSWDMNLASTYKVNYKFNGSLNFTYANDIIGDKGSPEYMSMTNYQLEWTHQQDPKFLPNSTFSASVSLSAPGYDKYNGNLQQSINAQTNSTIAYSKTWAGTPFSLSVNLQHSQNNRDSTVSMSLPNLQFTMNRIYPFQRKGGLGKKKWYEKVSLSYSAVLNNNINTTTKDFLTSRMFDDMKYGIKHSIPINTSFNILKYLNVSPSVNYNEKWYFTRINKKWSPEENKVIVSDTTHGFYRVYDYNASLSFSTIVYGMYSFGENKAISAIRHVMTPTVSVNYTPNFAATKHGFFRPVQTDAAGNVGTYSPYEQGIFGGPSRGESGSLQFSLNNNLEMKVRSKSDTTGFKKIKIFESLNLSSSYNFLADSMKLAPITISARTTLFKGLGININATLDPYIYNKNGQRTKDFAWANGSAGRITSFSFTFGYSVRSFFGEEGPGSGTGSETIPRNLTPNEEADIANMGVDPNLVRQTLTPEYYNFSVPWNFSFNYSLTYSHSSKVPKTIQTLGFNGNVNLTPKWGVAFTSGLDLEKWKLTATSLNVTRDLHCWQMGFTWVPLGFQKSWMFNINVKSSILQDLKFKKSNSFLDNLL